jgi:hypothetical protein
MARKREAPRQRQLRRASVVVDDTNIVQENVQSEWEKGCRWAGIALALTWGPMMAVGAWLGWM